MVRLSQACRAGMSQTHPLGNRTTRMVIMRMTRMVIMRMTPIGRVGQFRQHTRTVRRKP